MLKTKPPTTHTLNTIHSLTPYLNPQKNYSSPIAASHHRTKSFDKSICPLQPSHRQLIQAHLVRAEKSAARIPDQEEERDDCRLTEKGGVLAEYTAYPRRHSKFPKSVHLLCFSLLLIPDQAAPSVLSSPSTKSAIWSHEGIITFSSFSRIP